MFQYLQKNCNGIFCWTICNKTWEKFVIVFTNIYNNTHKKIHVALEIGAFAIAKMKKVGAQVSDNEGYSIRRIIIFELSYHEFNWQFHSPYFKTILYWFPCVLNCIWSIGSILSLTMTPHWFNVTHKDDMSILMTPCI